MGIRSKFHQFYPKRKSLAKNLLNKMSEHCFHPLLIHLPCPLSIFSQTGDFIYIIVDVLSNWDICCKFSFRGFTEENTKLGIISQLDIINHQMKIFYLIGDWGIVLSLLFTWLRNSQTPIGYIIPNLGYVLTNWGCYVQLGFSINRPTWPIQS